MTTHDVDHEPVEPGHLPGCRYVVGWPESRCDCDEIESTGSFPPTAHPEGEGLNP